ncbi:MAG TPA: ribonuclease HI family protein [Bacteroidota bacterium]
MIHAFTDGASRGNPGESGIGILLKDEQGNVLTSIFGYIGTTTNNVAEYTALITCLRLAQKNKYSSLIVHSDSELLVRQMQGKYRIKEPKLKKLAEQARAVIDSASLQCTFKHIVRGDNREADELANRGIDSRRPVHI